MGRSDAFPSTPQFQGQRPLLLPQGEESSFLSSELSRPGGSKTTGVVTDGVLRARLPPNSQPQVSRHKANFPTCCVPGLVGGAGRCSVWQHCGDFGHDPLAGPHYSFTLQLALQMEEALSSKGSDWQALTNCLSSKPRGSHREEQGTCPSMTLESPQEAWKGGQATESQNPMVPPLPSSQSARSRTVAPVTHAWDLWEAFPELRGLCCLPWAATPPGAGAAGGQGACQAAKASMPDSRQGGWELV